MNKLGKNRIRGKLGGMWWWWWWWCKYMRNSPFLSQSLAHLITNFKIMSKRHNIIQIHNIVLWDWQYYANYSSHSELSTNELVNVALGVNHAQGFDLDVDLHSVDVDDVAPPTVKLNDAKRHASLLSNLLLDNSWDFGVNEIISFQKLVGNLEKMTVAT
jgi:hypothetical protein